jgi:beta-lactam-binding protein with PASTA domain
MKQKLIKILGKLGIDTRKLDYLILSFFAIVLSICYFGYNLFFNINDINQLSLIIDSAIIMFLTMLISLGMFVLNDNYKKIINISTIALVAIYILLSLLKTNNVISVPTKQTMMDFIGMNINEVINWSKDKNVTIEQKYEYSDSVPEYGIISQSIKSGTLLKDIKTITLTVSAGPNYDKTVIISNLVGLNIDEALDIINKNFLNNVEINYEINAEIDKDIIVSQSVKGQMRRNDKLVLNISLGNADDLAPVSMIDLKNKSLFDATLWLKRNGIQYKLTFEFSDTVKRNNVLSQSIKENTTVDPKSDTVTLIVSKGKKIIVPDLMSMKSDDITKWIIDNNLKISYSDKYDEAITIGNIISSNYKVGDEIEEGTTIAIVISKGQLRMKSFTSVNEFRDWADLYNINYVEEYEFNQVAKGQIIRFSKNVDDVIIPGDTITIYISNGLAVTIPNFVGKTKTHITTTCNSIGLNCTFNDYRYSTSAKDIALSQNKTAGSQVVSGTYVSITLSKGTAKTFTVQFEENQITPGNPDETINTLKAYVKTAYPDVTFTFEKQVTTVLPNSGFIHESSPIKDGSSVTQGNSYKIWITIQ